MILISKIRLRPDHTKGALDEKIRRILRLGEHQSFSREIIRRSIDARKKPDIFYQYTVRVSVPGEEKILKRAGKNPNVCKDSAPVYRYPFAAAEKLTDLSNRPVIVGSGPAGMFCALVLAHAGLRPIVLERGDRAEERVRKVQHFWETGELDEETNVQFGEGGAGTFSDGKLNTGITDRSGRIPFILRTFAAHGADPSICFDSKPHIGTDVLRRVIVSIRREIEELGGEYRFHTCLTGLLEERYGTWLLTARDGETETVLKTDALVLAIGHSARDTFRMLFDAGFEMQPKAFAAGVRVEHPQRLINSAMYGPDCPYDLGAAPYKLTAQTKAGRGVFSFCMCPGGYVVNASSEKGALAVNGMSYSGRSGENANSAIIVTVKPEDFGGTDEGGIHPLSGIAFQEKLEKRAFSACNGAVPVQRYADFAAGRPSERPGSVTPNIRGKWAMGNVRDILPDFIASSIQEAMSSFEKRIPGFAGDDVLLEGVESRTSSPVRIVRDESGCALNHPGIYPCGEGAGYAGGITSAAADGMRIAEKILARLDFAEE